MVKLTDLVVYLQQLLEVDQIMDACPNGLQVEGKPEINSMISGVTACQDLLNQAVKNQADAILVHHGYFWKDEDACIVGIKKNRLQTLLQHNINLLSYHLPLDLHAEFGNNVQLAKLLGLNIEDQFSADGINLGFVGKLTTEMSGKQFADHVHRKLQRKPLYIPAKRHLKTIAWCTGAAQDLLEKAVKQGVDAYLTGEAHERTIHAAREYGIHFFAAGHHATERYGIQALGEHIARKYNLVHQFIDSDNPV